MNGLERRIWSGLTPLVLLALGCGRPATPQECDEIMERIARLEARARAPERPELEEEAVKSARERAKNDKTFDLCIGHRVTDRAMACVRRADTADAVRKCFR